MIRKKVLFSIGGLFVFFLFLIFLFFGKIIHFYAQQQIEDTLNAPVEISKVSVSYFPLHVSFEEIHVIDYNNLEFDLLFVDSFSFRLSLIPIVFKRFIIDEIAINNIAINEPRKKPYQLTKDQKAYYSLRSNLNNKDEDFNIDVNVDYFIKQSPLEMENFLHENKKVLAKLRHNIEDITSPALYRKLKKVQEELNSFLIIDKRTLKKQIKSNQSDQKLTQTKDYFMQHKKKFLDIKKDIIGFLDQIVLIENKLNNNYVIDYNRISAEIDQFYAEDNMLSELMMSNIMTDLLRNYYKNLTHLKYHYASLLDINTPANEYRKDKKGSYISLRFENTWPTLGVNSILINGKSKNNIFDAEILNFKSSLFEKGDAFSFSFNQSEKNFKGFSMFGVGAIDHTDESARFESNFKLVQNSSFLLDQTQHFLKNANTNINVSMDYFNSILALDLALNIGDIEFSKNLSNIFVRSILSSINDISFNIKLSGPLDHLDYAVSSSLDENFGFVYNLLKKEQEKVTAQNLNVQLGKELKALTFKIDNITDKQTLESTSMEFIEIINDIDEKMDVFEKRTAAL